VAQFFLRRRSCARAASCCRCHRFLQVLGAYAIWLPWYAHGLAAIGLAVGFWCISLAPADAPINRKGHFIRLLFALAVPALVYFFFLSYGGQRTAFNRRFSSPLCPVCRKPLRLRPAVSTAGKSDSVAPACSNCGAALT